MKNLNTTKAERDALAKVRAADAAHNEVMTRIAKRGGISLTLLRSMIMRDKDAFITKHREGKYAKEQAQ